MATQPQQPPHAPSAAQAVPTSSAPVQRAGAVAPSPKPKPVRRVFPKFDWLFVLAVVATVGQVVLLVLLYTTKETYSTLRKEDEDRIFVLQKATTVTQEDINNLEDSFLKEDEIIPFIQSLEKAEVMFNEFDFRFTSDIPEGKDTPFLSFEILAAGSKENIQLFIGSLLSSTYVLEATKIDIVSDTEDLDMARLTMNGNVYIQVLKK